MQKLSPPIEDLLLRSAKAAAWNCESLWRVQSPTATGPLYSPAKNQWSPLPDEKKYLGYSPRPPAQNLTFSSTVPCTIFVPSSYHPPTMLAPFLLPSLKTVFDHPDTVLLASLYHPFYHPCSILSFYHVPSSYHLCTSFYHLAPHPCTIFEPSFLHIYHPCAILVPSPSTIFVPSCYHLLGWLFLVLGWQPMFVNALTWTTSGEKNEKTSNQEDSMGGTISQPQNC